MSGELQTIPARHGVATFVPRGRTIKIINTYGKQVVSTWAFGLAAPPEEGEGEVDEKEIEGQVDELKEELSKGEVGDDEKKPNVKDVENEATNDDAKKEDANTKGTEEPQQENQQKEEKPENPEVQPKPDDADDPPEQAPETPDNEKSTDKKPGKRTWSSYIPSIPYRSKNQGQAQGKANDNAKQDEKAENAKKEATSKKWSSYLPTGKGFSSYVPNLQIPDTQGVVSAFKSSNSWDPNKSYAEQLYDFSKTPVGAGTLAAASGSGTASSLYAAYSAYTKLNPWKDSQPPMEYLSLPHTRAATNRLVPEVDDTLLTNLRNPLMTLIEDTSTGAHDTLTAACDANMYAAIGVDKPEEHGSCAENLVLALKELNEKAGLKGTKAVGADITVNIAPTPLHLFMNAPLQLDSDAQSEGSGAKGAKLSVEEPKNKKRSYVRFRAERDIVVVLSACPNEVGPQNGGRCMAANFMVEEPEEDLAASTSSSKKTKDTPKKSEVTKDTQKENNGNEGDEKPKGMPRLRGGPQKPAAVQKSAQMTAEDDDDPPESELPGESSSKPDETAKEEPKPEKAQEQGESQPKDVSKVGEKAEESKPSKDAPKKVDESKPAEASKSSSDAPKQKEAVEETKPVEAPKPKKKPKKLERRSATPKSEAS